MVPGRLNVTRVPKQAALVATASLLAVVLLAWPGRAVPQLDPGPFWPLVVGHTGSTYSDRLPAGPTYQRVSGRLASGLRVSSSGRVSGSPTETGTFSAVYEAREPNGSRYPVRLGLTVFKSDESDLSRQTPSFRRDGPYTTRTSTLTVDLTSTFDGQRIRTEVRLVRPVGATGPRPLLLFHRGRGFDHDDYTRLHARIASWGIAVASVEDAYSFAGRTFRAGNRSYDMFRAELGMQSASGVVDALADYLLDRSSDPQDSLGGSFDAENLFFAGHSRGGGAAHASHHRSFLLRLKGVIYLMAFDLRFFDAVRPPATSPAYSIEAAHPRVPSLMIAAENDGDLTYPIADQLIDRATGPATQVTLYGGVHNLIGDTAPSEGRNLISRTEERTAVADWMICFLKRWSEQDSDLDWRLYGGGHQGSGSVGVTSWRPSARMINVEDAQDNDLSRNLLGRNLVANLRRQEGSLHPSVGDLPSVGLGHVLLTPTDQVSIWRMASDRALDLTRHTRVVLRVAQTGTRGWSRTGLWLRILDGQGGQSYFRVWDPAQGGLLPDYTGLSPHDRFVDVHVDLDRFFAGGGTAADLSAALALDLFVIDNGMASRDRVVVDAVRFE